MVWSKKSPLVQKNTEARISKKSASEDHNSLPPQTHKPDGNSNLAVNYVKMIDEEIGNAHPSKMDLQSNAVVSLTTTETTRTPEKTADYVKYEELDEAEIARREGISNLRNGTEEGPAIFQVLAFFGGVSMVLTSVFDLQGRVRHDEGISPDFAVISFYSWAFGLFIMGLEGRKLLIEIHSLHIMVSNYMKLLRFVWGRGLFYIFAGSLQYCLSSPFSSVCGIFMMTLGLLMFALGLFSNLSLKLELNAVQNDGKIQAKFDFYDVDHDGYITQEQFKDSVIGLDDDADIDLDVEFRTNDMDNDGLISYPEFKKWVDTRNHKNQSLMEQFENAGFFHA